MGRHGASSGDPRAASPVRQIEHMHGSGAYTQRPLAVVRGEGLYLFDDLGNAFLDMTSGHGVALLGHSHPILAQAIADQSARLITCAETFPTPTRADLYDALLAAMPPGLNRFYLCNSGTEAVEAALKLARLLTGRQAVVAMRRGFHGRSMGALSATWNPKFRAPFEPLLQSFAHIPFNDLDAAEEAIGPATAAIIVEAVQGEGGVYPARPEFLQLLRRLSSRYGALLIVDEIQTGLGRTGEWLACQHAALEADIVCLGKGLAGGFPIGLIAWREELGRFTAGSHGSTFGGNPLACAAALATLSLIDKHRLVDRSARLGADLVRDLESIRHPLVREVRGQGLMVGMELRTRVTPLLKALMARGILALPAGPTVLRLLPPLIVGTRHLERVSTAIADCLHELGGTE